MGAEYHDPELRRRRSPWGVLALVMLTGIALMKNGADISLGPPQPAAAASPDRAAGEVFAPLVPPDDLVPALAERVRVPSLAIDAPLMDVGLDADGWIEAPPAEDRNLAGWYRNGVSPGQRGTAVLVGHVDNRTGPAVFYGLGSLRKGERVEVPRSDGRTAVFEVYGVEVVDKNDFPAADVYGDTGHAELRVITCGGGWSRRDGYAGNVVVYARLVTSR
ncbi:class F sortase [Streptomyces clavuligerus]|uniref:class F sortase n=1 Tax=Streptomyces clavuligerus TaxID=1901 RepID=UPI000810B1A7|nr:class F sortase [Streptomyces clavuligerus]ANW17049.1 class F sortase [Streptomyces clavuligerus]AXU11583.1 class F sortase [Streptomyces clavuligerus]MBY6301404.1 class F sortase [Streptomyces clavuligerus]QPL61700.1 class F sortase [Streptomyces clavuligerus]QPL67734.1 class F sortase [Streptomyces clavuligerus]